MTVSALRKPWDSPAKAMYACLMPWAARSAAIASDWDGGTTGSSSPWSSSTGQVSSLTWPIGARSTYRLSASGRGPTRPSR